MYFQRIIWIVLLFIAVDIGSCSVIRFLDRIKRQSSSDDDCPYVEDCVIQRNVPSARGTIGQTSSYDTYSCTTHNTRDYEVHVLSMYEPDGGVRGFQQNPSEVGQVMVTLTSQPGTPARPVKLVLTSYEAAHWIITPQADRPVTDVLIYSYYARFCNLTVVGQSRQPNFVITHKYHGYGRRENKATQLFTDVRRHFGLVTSFTGTYVVDSWTLKVGVTGSCQSLEDQNFCQVKRNGLYPDTSDCGRYIQCHEGTTFRRPCAPGTLWNDVIKTCDHERNVVCVGERDDSDLFQVSPQVNECLGSDRCWVKTNFRFHDNWNDCHGDQYVMRTEYGPLVGVILCSSVRYKLVMAEELNETFVNIGDGSGHGADHCEFVGGSESQSNLPMEFWTSPGGLGYYRYRWGQPLSYGPIGVGRPHGWTGKYYVKWYECGVSIPGSNRVVELVLPTPATTVPTTARTTTTTPRTTTTTPRTTTTTPRTTTTTPRTTTTTPRTTTTPTTTTTPRPRTSPTAPSSGSSDWVLLSTPESQEREEGDVVNMECKVGKAGSQIYWYKDGGALSDGSVSGISIIDIWEGSQPASVLFIDSLLRDHQGSYQCAAYHDDEDDPLQADAEITVQLRACGIGFRFQPEINYDVDVGESVTIRAGPNVTQGEVRTWLKDGTNRINPAEDRYDVTMLGWLIIRDVCLSDEGEYKMEVRATIQGRVCVAESITTYLRVGHLCGQPTILEPEETGHIVGGTRTVHGSHPWMVMLWETQYDNFCGGSLISKQWVVTAAHCIREFREKTGRDLGIQNFRVKLGKWDSTIDEEEEIVLAAIEIIVHPGYTFGAYDDDIALLKLERPVTYTEHAHPICLMSPEEQESYFFTHIGTQVISGRVTGWGRLIEGGQSARYLQKIDIPLQTQDTCRAYTTDQVTDNMFCAGYANRQTVGDACRGDSGGPLAIRHGNAWYLVGVVSWGEGCGQPGKFGFYTKVANYYNWILQKMGTTCQ